MSGLFSVRAIVASLKTFLPLILNKNPGHFIKHTKKLAIILLATLFYPICSQAANYTLVFGGSAKTYNVTSGVHSFDIDMSSYTGGLGYHGSIYLEKRVNGGSWAQVDYFLGMSYSNPNAANPFPVNQTLATGITEYRAQGIFVSPHNGDSGSQTGAIYTFVHVAPSAPSTISVPSTDYDGNGSVPISWSASAGATSYDIERSSNGGASYTNVEEYNASSGSTTVTDSGLTSNTYKYRVKACGSAGCGSWKTSGNVIVRTLPGTPSSISVPSLDIDGDFNVTWGTASGVVDSYQLSYRKADYGTSSYGGWQNIPLTSAQSNARSYSLLDKTTGKYQYRVRACNAAGCSSSYKTSSVVTVKLHPNDVSTIEVPNWDNDGVYEVRWGTVLSGGATATSYQLEFSSNNGVNWSSPLVISSGSTDFSSRTYTNSVSSPLPDGEYYYRVRACNSYGCSDNDKVSSNFTEVVHKPNSPSSLALLENTIGSYQISWGQGAGQYISSYQLQRGKADYGSSVYVWETISANVGDPNFMSRVYEDSDLSDGHYQYRARPCNSFGDCADSYAYSDVVTVLNQPATSSSSILSPANFIPTSAAQDEFVVSWSPANGNDISSYQLLRDVADYGTSNYTRTTIVLTQSDTDFANPSYTELSPADGEYRYKILACNASGCSGEADSPIAQTSVLDIPLSPTSVWYDSSNPDADGVFVVEWTPSVGIVDKYQIMRHDSAYGQADYGDFHSRTDVYDATSFPVSGLEDGDYRYKVRACNASGCTSSYRWGNKFQVLYPPTAPLGVAVTPSETLGLFDIEIDPGEGYVDSYYYLEEITEERDGTIDVEQSYGNSQLEPLATINGYPAEWIIASSRPTLSSDVSTLYEFKVQACNATNCSEFTFSNPVSVVPPGTPNGLTATDLREEHQAGSYDVYDDDAYFTIRWDAVDITDYLGNQVPVRYNLMETLPDIGELPPVSIGTNNELERVFAMVDGAYKYQVQACIDLDLDSDPSTASEERCGPYTNQLTVNVEIPGKGFIPHGWSYGYYFLNERFEGVTPKVYAILDETNYRWGAMLSDTNSVLSAGQALDIGAITQGSAIYSDKPLAIASTKNGTDMPVPIEFAGTEFAVPLVRGLNYIYVQNLNDGPIDIEYFDGAVTSTQTIPKNEIARLNTTGSTGSVTIQVVTADSNVLVSHARYDTAGDAYPVPPAGYEFYGVKTGSAYAGAFSNTTTITQSTNSGEVTEAVLDVAQKLSIEGWYGTQGSGGFTRVQADKLINAIQAGDGDGGEQTTFLPTSFFANKYVLPMDVQYLAMGCLDAGTLIEVYDPGDLLVDSVTCDASGLFPGKAFLGSETNGVQFVAGSRVEASHPIYLIYESSNENNEYNLAGAIDGIELTSPVLDVDLTYGSHLSWHSVAGASRYLIEVQDASDGSWSQVGESARTHWDLGSISADTRVRVIACSANDICSAPVEGTLLNQPSTELSYELGENGLSLSWNSDTELAPTYELERSSDGGSSWTAVYSATAVGSVWIDVGSPGGVAIWIEVEADTSNYRDSGLLLGSYGYRVRACLELCSDWVALDPVEIKAPDQPDISINYVVGADDVSISWECVGVANCGTNSVDFRYELERYDSLGEWSSLTTDTHTATSFSDQDIPVGSYQYRTRSCATYCSDWDSISVDVGATEPPLLIASYAAATGNVALSWTGIANGAFVHKLYRTDEQETELIYSGTELEYEDPLASQGDYLYWVESCIDFCSDQSNTYLAEATGPDIPIFESIEFLLEFATVEILWSSSGETATYDLERFFDGAEVDSVDAISGLIHNDVGLPVGLYQYRIRACSAFCGDWSGLSEEIEVRLYIVTQHFQYDRLGRLDTGNSESELGGASYLEFDYDETGNRTAIDDLHPVMTDPDGDYDSDGVSNHCERVNGFNPLDASDGSVTDNAADCG